MKAICDKCKKTFKSEAFLRMHLAKNIACDRPPQCNNCKREFTTRRGLEIHTGRIHPCEPVNSNSSINPNNSNSSINSNNSNSSVNSSSSVNPKHTSLEIVKPRYILKFKSLEKEIQSEVETNISETDKRIQADKEIQPKQKLLKNQNMEQNMNTPSSYKSDLELHLLIEKEKSNQIDKKIKLQSIKLETEKIRNNIKTEFIENNKIIKKENIKKEDSNQDIKKENIDQKDIPSCAPVSTRKSKIIDYLNKKLYVVEFKNYPNTYHLLRNINELSLATCFKYCNNINDMCEYFYKTMFNSNSHPEYRMIFKHLNKYYITVRENGQIILKEGSYRIIQSIAIPFLMDWLYRQMTSHPVEGHPIYKEYPNETRIMYDYLQNVRKLDFARDVSFDIIADNIDKILSNQVLKYNLNNYIKHDKELSRKINKRAVGFWADNALCFNKAITVNLDTLQ